MQVIFIANAEQEEEIKTKITNNEVELIFKNQFSEATELEKFDACFILNQDIKDIPFADLGTKPLFINAVIDTLSILQLPINISRINAWPGFLQRELWEIATENRAETESFFNHLGWKTIVVKDEPGLVAARVVSMIINEAFFSFNEKVSSKEEIDLAMKLGTNYPYGPFEWGEKIGLNNVLNLLKKLSEKDNRYLPSIALENVIASN